MNESMSDKVANKYHELNQEIREEMHDFFEEVKEERDELKLKIKLGKAELSDKWDVVEEKWHSFKDKSAIISEATGKAGGDIALGFKKLGAEIKHAYKDIRAGIDKSKLTK